MGRVTNISDWAMYYKTALQMVQDKDAATELTAEQKAEYKHQRRLSNEGLKRFGEILYCHATQAVLVSKAELELLIGLLKNFPILYNGSEAALLFLFRELSVYGKKEVRPLLSELANVMQNKAVCRYVYDFAESRNIEVFCEWLKKAATTYRNPQKVVYLELARQMRNEMLLFKGEYPETQRRQYLLRLLDL